MTRHRPVARLASCARDSRGRQVIELKGEGMPVHGVPSEFGSLHVELMVALPSQISAEDRRWVESHLDGPTDPSDVPKIQPTVYVE